MKKPEDSRNGKTGTLMNKAQLIAQIRFNLAQMRSANRHHEFEHLARHLARAKIHSNILPATGPVSAGGDGGRDFETYRTSITPSLSGLFDRRSSGMRPVAFACTLEQRIERKIRADLSRLAEPACRSEVVYMCEADVPVGRRNVLIDWARDAHGIALQIFDGTAISEMLAEADVFWIAQEFLRLSAEVYPVPIGGRGWYDAHLERWRGRTPLPFSAADFCEVKAGIRHSTGIADARPDLPVWLSLMQVFIETPALRSIVRSAIYEIAVATLRAKGELNPLRSLLDDYLRDLEDWIGSADLEDAAVLLAYAYGARTLGNFRCEVDYLLSWHAGVDRLVEREIVDAKGPARLAAMLRIRALLKLKPNSDEGGQDHEAAFTAWNAMLSAAEDAPLFPIETFIDYLAAMAPMIGGHPGYIPLVERAETLLATRAGPAKAAGKSFDRGVAHYGGDHLLAAIRDLHRSQHHWFTGDSLIEFQNASFLLAHSYLELGLAYAGKYVALVGNHLALHSDRPEMRTSLPRFQMLLADADDAAGNSLAFMAQLAAAIGSHGVFERDAFGEDHHPELAARLGQVASLRAVAARLGDGHLDCVDAVLADWAAPLREQIVELSNEPGGFRYSGSDEAVWSGINEAFLDRPLGDANARRRVEWRALGVCWVANFPNEVGAAAACEEFIARFQIVQAVFAPLDLMLFPGQVTLELQPDGCQGFQDGSGITAPPTDGDILVRVPLGRDEHTRSDFEDGARAFIACIGAVLSPCSLLEDETLFARVEPSLSDALGRVFLGRPYRELYIEMTRVTGSITSRRSVSGIFAANHPFTMREHPLLTPPAGLAPEYDARSAQRAIHDHYERLAPAIRYTLNRLKEDSRISRLLGGWHAEGLRDWEILSILVNAAVNVRAPVPDGEVTPDYIARFREAVTIVERPGDALSPDAFSSELLTICRKVSLAAIIASLKLKVPPILAKPGMTEFILETRYRIRSDDVEHVDIFGWNSSAA